MYDESLRREQRELSNATENEAPSNAPNEADGRGSYVLFFLTLAFLLGALATWADSVSRGRVAPPIGAAREDDLGRSGRRW